MQGLMCAQTKGTEQHIDDLRSRYVAPTAVADTAKPIPFFVPSVPSVSVLASRFAKLGPRALGESCLGGEIYR
eukprot:12201619-Karenia_brevis.AAC.1